MIPAQESHQRTINVLILRNICRIGTTFVVKERIFLVCKQPSLFRNDNDCYKNLQEKCCKFSTKIFNSAAASAQRLASAGIQ